MYFFISVKKLGNENFKATVFTLMQIFEKVYSIEKPNS